MKSLQNSCRKWQISPLIQLVIVDGWLSQLALNHNPDNLMRFTIGEVHSKPPDAFSSHRLRIKRNSEKLTAITGAYVWQPNAKREAKDRQIKVCVDIECRWLKHRRRKTPNSARFIHSAGTATGVRHLSLKKCCIAAISLASLRRLLHSSSGLDLSRP